MSAINGSEVPALKTFIESKIQVLKLLLLGCIIIFGVVSLIKEKKRKEALKEKNSQNGKSKDSKSRKLGTWIPDYSFKTPEPAPFKNWSIEHTKPLPYRAFRHKYTVTMGIRNMDWDSWIELDNQWLKFHEDKLNHLKERGTELYHTSKEAMPAAYELLDEFKRYLPKRYPTLFKETDDGLDNLVTGELWNFKPGGSSLDPMLIAANLLQDDLAIMLEQPDGQYYLKGGAVILPGFWRLKDKLGMPLSAIHTSGDVPKYDTHLKNGMEKFFVRLTCDKPVVRNNYFIQTDDNLAWSSSIGDENKEVVGWYTAEKAKTPDQLYFRSERQSLRRLPKTGAIIFTIRTYFLPMTELASEPNVPRRLLNAVNSWTDDVREYRGLSKFEDVLLPYLEEKALEQEKNYIDDTEHTTYPY